MYDLVGDEPGRHDTDGEHPDQDDHFLGGDVHRSPRGERTDGLVSVAEKNIDVEAGTRYV